MVKKVVRVGKIPAIISILIILGGCTLPLHYGQLSKRTEEEIRQKWLALPESVRSDELFSVSPQSSPDSMQAGRLSLSARREALESLRFVRYLAGVSGFVLEDAQLSRGAQQGALLLSMGSFSHYPLQPDGMPASFYDEASLSLKESSLCKGWEGLRPSLDRGLVRCDGLANILTVSHRRWLLNPRLQKVGIGFYDNFAVFSLKDASGSDHPYEMVAWPSPGSFPREYFDADDPWSVTLSTDYYMPVDNRVEVTVTRLDDARVWELEGSSGHPENGGAFLTVDQSDYGDGATIIFRPPVSELAQGEGADIVAGDYEVVVGNIRNRQGASGAITYRVDFFDLEPEQGSPTGNTSGTPEYQLLDEGGQLLDAGEELPPLY